MRAILLPLLAILFFVVTADARAVESWEKLDRRLKGQIFQLNVGLKMRLKDSLWCHLADLSPKYRFPVFSTSKDDKGFRVVGLGSAFPVSTLRKDKGYFLTSSHVIDTPDPLIKECERFYAAMRMYAEQTAQGKDVEARFNELLNTVNLSMRGNALSGNDRALYQQTVDAIWDTYETYLSMRVDPGRAMFKKYANQAKVDSRVGYFLHAPGPVSQPPIEGSLYKMGKPPGEPDLAILTTPTPRYPGIELDLLPPSEGQEIQVIGYPMASEQIDQDADNYYSPTFATGRVSRVAPRILQVDAPTTNGNSGGPVVSLRGKLLGVVVRRAVSTRGGELPNFAGAVTIPSIQAFAPELFGKTISKN